MPIYPMQSKISGLAQQRNDGYSLLKKLWLGCPKIIPLLSSMGANRHAPSSFAF
jgi:hypothetical protein